MTELLSDLSARHPEVHEVRQCGLVAGIELRRTDGSKFPAAERIGEEICLAARKHGLLTRPILDTVVLMPPLCVSNDELEFAANAIDGAIRDGFGA
jgi:adenosylmethionine-8-amino-7-oxononanoate aminotransferase